MTRTPGHQHRDLLRMTMAATALAVLLPVLAHGAESNRPNIVFIMVDDLGWKELGCYGQEKIRTPNVDRLAAQGMRFTQYYSGSAVCAPARCNLLTGKHGGHAYIRNNHAVRGKDPKAFTGQLPIPADEVTIAETLKAKGYATGCFGKWGLGAPGSSGDPLDQGFDRFYGYNCQRHAHNLYPRFLIDQRKKDPLEGNTRSLTGEQYAPQRIADKMLEFVRKHRDKPFFLYYATVLPHLALQAPDEEIAAYRGTWQEEPYTGKAYLPHPTPKSCYAAMITFMDKQVGRLMALLKELGLEDNTVVFFTSDNGTTHLKQVDYEFFESVGPLRGLKGSLYEGGIRMPMVVRWPGKIAPDTVTDHLAAHYDVPATLADIAGTTFDADHDGISFLPTLLGNKQKPHEYLFWEFAGYGGQMAVRMGPWKGIKQNMNKKPNPPLELYHLSKDIGETTNVADQHPEIAARVEAIMQKAHTEPRVEAFRLGVKEPKSKDGNRASSSFNWKAWRRPVDNPVFTSKHGNNHDSVLFVEPELEYPYHLIISHTPAHADLWRAKKFSWSSADWELVSDEYKIANHYEYDDGVKVDGTYYIYEAGQVYTFTGPLEEASGKWERAGTFPMKQCDDIGVYYEDGVFHIFGEYGHFPHGPDGTSLSHFISRTGLGDWKLVSTKAADANPDGGHKYGVGDPTIAKIQGWYYIFCDRESVGSPYKVIAWRSKDINAAFEYLGIAIKPRRNEVDDWDNYRIQDADIGYAHELSRYVMTCNMKDHDGNPGGHFPTLKKPHTRVIGVFYSDSIIQRDAGK